MISKCTGSFYFYIYGQDTLPDYVESYLHNFYGMHYYLGCERDKIYKTLLPKIYNGDHIVVIDKKHIIVLKEEDFNRWFEVENLPIECPLCGNLPILTNYEDKRGNTIYKIICSKCGLLIESDSEEEVIKKWNSRL